MKYLTGDLLLLATMLTTVNSAECQCQCDEERLNIEPSSVDDRYPTCREEMMGNITAGDLLTRERQATPSFSTAWSQAERCNLTVANLTDLHVTALTLYTSTYNRTFPLIFDVDARSLGPNAKVYYRYFLFKSLHFLLTDALRLLRGQDEVEAELGQDGKGCLLVYADSGRRDNLRGEVGDQVRTGHFVLASTRRYSSSFDLTIRTCHGHLLPRSHSRHCRSSSGLNVLVPPYELFRVVAVKRVPNKWGGALKWHFYLESIGTMTNLNCAMTSAV
ncbi:ecto-ADP-ribosyltransferase 4 isoform X1 [Coregonus clupeaformis]|uniref:ecto-ADP-ribosyltransferase 4 isoform X1 n=2 Tax=Coregonus clupeaformis TaxID=59861 RepID=UPI001E1C6151|nr:ecto-ADP-ribosyltransferase 4 isoform X1 [Coregonus clupeaformis]